MPEEIQSFQQVRSVLDPLQVDKGVKAQAFDAFYDAPDAQEFKRRFDKLNLPRESKAALWDLRFGAEQRQLGARGKMATPEYLGEVATAELPAIGATVGALGGPLGVPVGAAAGTAARQLIRSRKGQEVPATVSGSLAEMGTEAAKQSAYEAGGRLVGAGFKALRKPAAAIYEHALKFPEVGSLEGKELERALEERGEVARRGLSTRTPVTEKGAQRAAARATATKPKVTAEVSAATQANKTIKTADILAPLDEQIKLWSAPDPADAKPLIKQRARIMNRLIAQGQDQWMTPDEAQALKEQLSKQLSSKAFRQGAPSAGKIAGKTAQYGGFKEAIEQVAPGVEEANRSIYQDLALKDAIRKANKLRPGLLNHLFGTVVGAGALGAAGHRGLGEAWMIGQIVRTLAEQPRMVGRVAIILDQAGVQLPRIAEPAVKYGLRFGQPLTEDIPPSRFPTDQAAQK